MIKITENNEADNTENHNSQMIPELQKLIKTLKASNLSKEEFIEIANQVYFFIEVFILFNIYKSGAV